jgi:hypothetical protein
MKKTISLLLIFTLGVSSSVMIGSVFGQSTANLPVPKFTVNYADNSYEAPASTSIDPYTGVTTQNPAYHVENRTLQLVITNIPYANTGSMYYIIQMRGHFSGNWARIFKGYSSSHSGSDSAFTVLSFSSSQEKGGEAGRLYGGESFAFPYEGQVDFQVKAEVWGEVMSERTATNPFGGSITTLFASSDWSRTQTLIIGQNDSTTTPTAPNTSPSQDSTTNPQQNPSSGQPDAQAAETQPNFNWIEIVIFTVVGVVIALLITAVVLLRRRVQTLERKNET